MAYSVVFLALRFGNEKEGALVGHILSLVCFCFLSVFLSAACLRLRLVSLVSCVLIIQVPTVSGQMDELESFS